MIVKPKRNTVLTTVPPPLYFSLCSLNAIFLSNCIKFKWTSPHYSMRIYFQFNSDNTPCIIHIHVWLWRYVASEQVLLYSLLHSRIYNYFILLLFFYRCCPSPCLKLPLSSSPWPNLATPDMQTPSISI